MVNFILADNQELTAFALRTLIRELESATIHVAVNKDQLISQLQKEEKSIVVLDYTLYDIQDEEQLLVIIERFPRTQWIMVSDDLTIQVMRKLVYTVRNVSIVFKDSPFKLFRHAIDYATRGDRYLCQRAAEVLICQQADEEQRPKVLTETEIEILRGVAQGKTTKEIAYERYSSIHTVNTHKKNIFRKLQVNTAHEAIKYAFRAGLVDPSEFYI
ncbi:response regulator transcription factor [Prevotella sp. tf2-5]|jgi:DNA-binding NarL/FixJ family response regulator|uniref:response regulator transcription factor n=1 Tax=Prevotella sp. tf2-5 TaxID=1761889 RepID=UPI0008EDA2E0|nr:response regulator transcription factor [Prevotella sp. tf2-5]MCR5711337.1 response regulator transcription factor [Prevotella sp.]SFO54580.1 DNA-binding response regulator, NarL/FixJ family, contains REC and HTH domains [Prevotella sp. tf2-5]